MVEFDSGGKGVIMEKDEHIKCPKCKRFIFIIHSKCPFDGEELNKNGRSI